MSIDITYQDTVRILSTEVDGYNNESVLDEACVDAVFEQSTGWRHSGNQSAITGDGRVLIDPNNLFVQANAYRLEGMLLVAQLFGASFASSWYRITNVDVARDGQLTNQVDHLTLTLKKTKALPGVS